ncbi:glycosyltransferase family 2 protein [Halobaculum litoreum]|uniref:Glycosyltransferase family 2 protein n=1 Tax=Halobaculum litoreum TaxID=3031998 RepID=A0ABD5Y0Y6_9EURY
MVGRAIDSALAQTVDDIEVVVVDDGSEDDTEAVVTAYDDDRVRYLAHESNRGVSAARNTGLAAATGEYVAFLDSDDEWLPRKLERQLSTLAERGEGWVGAYCEVATGGLSPLDRLASVVSDRIFRSGVPREGGRELAEALLSMQVFMGPGSTLLVERDVLNDAGGFDEGLSLFEDWDLVLRVLAVGKLAHVDEALAVTHFTGNAPASACGERPALSGAERRPRRRPRVERGAGPAHPPAGARGPLPRRGSVRRGRRVPRRGDARPAEEPRPGSLLVGARRASPREGRPMSDPYDVLACCIHHQSHPLQVRSPFNHRSFDAINRTHADLDVVVPTPFAPPVGPSSEYSRVPETERWGSYVAHYPRFLYMIPKRRFYHVSGDSSRSASPGTSNGRSRPTTTWSTRPTSISTATGCCRTAGTTTSRSW